MSLTFYYLTILFAIILESLFFLLIGIPLLLLVLWLLNKYGVTRTTLKRRWGISIVTNILLAVVVGLLIWFEPYLYDDAFDYAMESSGLSTPMYYVSDVNYPQRNNGGDDFGVDKKLKLIGSLSKNDIQKLTELTSTDTGWSVKGDVYYFQESWFEAETRISVEIDVNNGIVTTSTLKW